MSFLFIAAWASPLHCENFSKGSFAEWLSRCYKQWCARMSVSVPFACSRSWWQADEMASWLKMWIFVLTYYVVCAVVVWINVIFLRFCSFCPRINRNFYYFVSILNPILHVNSTPVKFIRLLYSDYAKNNNFWTSPILLNNWQWVNLIVFSHIFPAVSKFCSWLNNQSAILRKPLPIKLYPLSASMWNPFSGIMSNTVGPLEGCQLDR